MPSQAERINDFFSHFDQRVKTATIEVCKSISESDADVYILMARKAACFFDCLQDLGLVTFHGVVTSDRILEMDTQWLQNKNVVIVDDAVISGTTIYELIEKLQGCGVKSTHIYALCTNKKYYRDVMLTDHEGVSLMTVPFLELEDEECLKMCTDIVYALSKFIRPYSVDFPLFKKNILTEKKYRELIRSSEWVIDEISTANQHHQDITVLTWTPKSHLLKRMDEILGIDFSNISMPKIRTYIKYNSAKNEYTITVLPVVVLKPIFEFHIEKTFEKLIYNKSQEFKNHFTTTVSKIHFIQYVSSGVLGEIWRESSEFAFDDDHILIPDTFNNSLLFSPFVSNLIYSAVTYFFDKSNSGKTGLEYVKIAKDELVDEGFTGLPNQSDNLIGFQDALTKPFLGLYYKEELEARKLVIEHGKNVFKQADFIQTLDRLKRGYSVNYLQNQLSSIALEGEENLGYDVNRNKFLSLFLDKAIDLGIIVPIIAKDVQSGSVFYYRAYRHGEDVCFGEIEFLLCSYFLDAFVNAYKKDKDKTIPQLVAEKLIVLFLKIGLSAQHKLFVQFISNLPRYNLQKEKGVASIRSYLYGQVATFTSYDKMTGQSVPVYVNEETSCSWITQKMLDKGLLYKIDNEELYRVADNTYETLDQSKKNQAVIIGDTFGELLRDGKAGLLEVRDLVTITSCVEPKDIAGSLAAELVIFNNRWLGFYNRMMDEISNPKRYFLVIANMRRQVAMHFTAINSGQDKFIRYKRKQALEVINRVAKELEKERPRDAATWLGFWSPNAVPLKEGSPVNYLVEAMGIWLLKVSLLYRILEYVFRKLVQFEDGLINEKNKTFLISVAFPSATRPDKIDDRGLLEVLKLQNEKALFELESGIREYQAKIAQWCPKASYRYDNYGLNTVNISSLQHDEYRNLHVVINNNLTDLYLESKLLIEDVDAIVTPYGKIAVRSDYTQAIYFNFSVQMKELPVEKRLDLINRHLRRLKSELIQQNTTGKEKEIFFYVEDAMQVTANEGFWIFVGGVDGAKDVMQIFTGLNLAFGNKGPDQWVLFKDLKDDHIITVSDQDNEKIRYRYFRESAGFFLDNIKIYFEEPDLIIVSNKSQYEQDISNCKQLLNQKGLAYSSAKGEKLFTERPYPHEAYICSFSRLSKERTAPIKTIKIPDRLPGLEAIDLMEQINSCDIGIISMRPLESSVVNAGLEELNGDIQGESKKKYYGGVLAGADGYFHTVVHMNMGGMGNVSASAMYQLFVKDFNPKLIILFGTAGGVFEKVKIGDVLISEKIIYYELGKEKPEGFEREVKVYVIDQNFRDHHVNPYFISRVVDKDEVKMSAASGNTEPIFSIGLGIIGCGEKIIADHKNPIRGWLNAVDRKTNSFEMESVGAFQAEEVNRIFYGKRSCGVISIRAIADYGDPDKNSPDIEKLRRPALMNGMIFLKDFVSTLPDLSYIVDDPK